MKMAMARSQLLLKFGSMLRKSRPPGPVMAETLATMTSRPPTARTAKKAAAMTAVIIMKNWIMSMMSTPQSPVTAAKTTLRRPTTASVSQRLRPKRMAAILQAARLTVAMMMQLNRNPR